MHSHITHRSSSHHVSVATKECGKPFTRKLVVRGVESADTSSSHTSHPQHQLVDVYVTRNAAHVRSWIQTHLGLSPPVHDQNQHQNSTAAATAATSASDVDDSNNQSSSSSVVVGFDVEWRPNFSAGGTQNKTALVQLSSHTSALLIQMKPQPQSPSSSQSAAANTLIRRQGQGSKSDDDRRELLQVLGWMLSCPHILKVTTTQTALYQPTSPLIALLTSPPPLLPSSR